MNSNERLWYLFLVSSIVNVVVLFLARKKMKPRWPMYIAAFLFSYAWMFFTISYLCVSFCEWVDTIKFSDREKSDGIMSSKIFD